MLKIKLNQYGEQNLHLIIFLYSWIWSPHMKQLKTYMRWGTCSNSLVMVIEESDVLTFHYKFLNKILK